jgi:hypothetical protein
MKKLHEYEQHAAECREMARTEPATHRAQLEQMAQTWDQLAEARRKQLAKLGRIDEGTAESWWRLQCPTLDRQEIKTALAVGAIKVC